MPQISGKLEGGHHHEGVPNAGSFLCSATDTATKDARMKTPRDKKLMPQISGKLEGGHHHEGVPNAGSFLCSASDTATKDARMKTPRDKKHHLQFNCHFLDVPGLADSPRFSPSTSSRRCDMGFYRLDTLFVTKQHPNTEEQEHWLCTMVTTFDDYCAM